MSVRVVTAAPAFITFEGAAGPVSLGLHNIIRFAPCKGDPDRTFIWSRGHHHTTTVVTMPHAEVDALIQAKLRGEA
jgi:hypothetical protein